MTSNFDIETYQREMAVEQQRSVAAAHLRQMQGKTQERLENLHHDPLIQAVLESREPILTLIDTYSGKRQDIFLNGVTRGFPQHQLVVNYVRPIIDYFQAKLVHSTNSRDWDELDYSGY